MLHWFSFFNYHACLCSFFKIEAWIRRIELSMTAKNGVIASLMGTAVWCLVFRLSEEDKRSFSVKLLMVLTLIFSALALIAAAYNNGDPIDWLLCKRCYLTFPYFHLTLIFICLHRARISCDCTGCRRMVRRNI